MSKRALLLVTLLLVQFNLAAKEAFLLSYEGMFDRLKVLNKGNYQYADIGFYLVTEQGEVCPVTQAELVTSTRNQTLTVNEQARMYLPFDEQMDKDKALVAVSTQNNVICQLKLQLEVQMTDNFEFTQANAYTMQQEFDALMDGLAGFFVRNLMPFLMPDVTGLTITLNSQMNINLPDIKCEDVRCVVTPTDDWQGQAAKLLDGVAIKTITPHISQ